MKKITVLLIAATAMLSSCGTAAQLASSDNGQRFQDGIYSNASSLRSRAEKVEEKAETQELVEKTKASQIYLFGDKKDTVLIPDNMAATVKFDREIGSTVVSVYENPYDWRNYIMDPWYYYSPYSIASSWYWSRHYNPWYYSARWSYPYWRYSSWYYDPWYYGGLYDPWYYGYAGLWGWDPWFHMHHHYAGWYGGWYDPHWGHHHKPGHGGPGYKPDHNRKPDRYYGTRNSTGSDRLTSGSNSLRRGTTVSTRPINRNVTASNTGSTVTSRPTGGRSNITRTSPVSRTAVRGTTGSSSSQRESVVTRQSNHRRPAVSSQRTTGTSSQRTTGTSSRGTVSSQSYRRSQTENVYNRSSSQSYERSSSSNSYNRSSISTGSSRSSSGSAARSGGGGSVSRSSGGSGGGMRR